MLSKRRQPQIYSEPLEEAQRQNNLPEYAHLRAIGGIIAELEFAVHGASDPSVGASTGRLGHKVNLKPKAIA